MACENQLSLYEENKGLLYHVAKRYRWACERDPAIDMDDLIQAGYMGLVAAQEAWEPSRGSWSNVAIMYVKNAMRAALGIHGSRQRAEHGALSLDRPITEDGDSTLMDTLEDTALPEIDAMLIQNDLQCRVRRAVEDHPIVKLHDLEGQPIKAISASTGLPADKVVRERRKSFSALRRNMDLRRLIDIDTRYYAHKGIRAFNIDWMSTTEAAAFWRIEARAKHEECEISEAIKSVGEPNETSPAASW